MEYDDVYRREIMWYYLFLRNNGTKLVLHKFDKHILKPRKRLFG